MNPERLLDGRLKLRHLVLVTTIAEQGTLVGAAGALHVTQPVVTRALHEAESVVGAELFTRGPRGVRPTAYGEILLEHAHAVLGNLRSAAERIDELRRVGIQPVRVGTNLAGAFSLLPPAVIRLKAEHPSLTVTVVEGVPADLDARLTRGEVDLLVGRLQSDHAGKFRHLALYEEPVGLVVRHEHPAARPPVPALEELRDFPWILPGRPSVLREELDEFFARSRIPLPRNMIECSTILTLRAILLRTDAIAPLPLLIGARDEALTNLPVALETVPRAIGITTLADRPPAPSARLLIGHLVAEAQEISGELAALDTRSG
ncbi:LysR substrate-binding domain-containing protein [Streptomyces sp. NPDC019531]|uniref:LysR substrate-binding domain-containing protein n=1 Tax=Streptomyces sp. NPDC019531 TaxID=3365062 RepID=UPI00384C4E71